MQTVRPGGFGEQPYLQEDKRIYYQDIVMHCFGEWSYEKVKDLKKLGGFNLVQIISRRKTGTSAKILWNVL